MKILVDARTFGDMPSGIGIYTYNFLKELVKHKDVEIELVSDISSSDEMQYLSTCENVKLHLLGKKIQKTFSVIGYVRYIQKLIYDVKPDVFWEPNNLFPIKLVNPYGKIVVTVHDLFPLYMPENYGKIYPIYFRFGIKNMLKYTDGIIFNSKETMDITCKYFPQAKTKKCEVLYIPIEKKVETSIEDKDYFLYIGNLESRKGTDILLRSFEKYRAAGGKKKLLLAGNIREASIEMLLEEISKTTNAVEYLGYATKHKKDELLANCSCFIFPSRAEGFGIPIIEAMHYEKPIIASDLSIFAEVIGECVAKFSLKNEDELMELMLEKQKQVIDAKQYRSVYSKYEPNKLTEKLLAYFGEMTNE